MLDEDLFDQVDIGGRGLGEIDHAHPIQPKIEKDSMVAKLQVGVDQADPSPQFLV